MYDKKTWLVLALCGGLLAANIYYSNKNRAAADAEKARQAELQKNTTPAPDLPVPTDTGLVVEQPPPPTEEETQELETPKVVYTLTNIGGGVKIATLKDELEVHSKTDHVELNRWGSGPIGTLAGANETLDTTAYTYKPEQSIPRKKAVYVAKLPSGLIAKKTFSVIEGDKEGSPYLLDFNLTLENGTAAPLPLQSWSLFLGEASPLYQAEVAAQTGFFWREGDKIQFTNGTSFNGGMFSSSKAILRGEPSKPVEFAGVTNQFFVTALRPKAAAATNIWAKNAQVKLPNTSKAVTSVRAALQLPAATLAPKEVKSIDYLLFTGPKNNRLLRKMEDHWGDGWADLMQYGWYSAVSRTLNWLLNKYHNLLDGVAPHWSWGLAIILLTITVRVTIWPLHAKSTHTMKRMAKLQPEMAKLKEKYADDPNKLNTETMGLYRKYGINPLGGCLPMFIQIPIFFGFYRMLQYAVELRGQGFLWVPDLSQPDTLQGISLFGLPINILPIVMAITSFLQIRMTPKSGDATQQKIMMFMPFMFFFFCYNFASALALYWTTQNLFSIGQTWLMSKVPEPELKARSTSDRKSWVQRMAERQAEYQRQQREGGNMRDVTPEKKRRPKTGG